MGKGRTATCLQVPHRSVNIFEDPYSRVIHGLMGHSNIHPLLIEITPYRISEAEEEGMICGPKRGEKMRLLQLR